jgi:hypothetical protein
VTPPSEPRCSTYSSDASPAPITLSPTKRAELRRQLKEKPGLNRYLRVTKSGLLRIDKTKIATETALDGKYLLRTSDPSISAEDVARGYKALAEVERGWRT